MAATHVNWGFSDLSRDSCSTHMIQTDSLLNVNTGMARGKGEAMLKSLAVPIGDRSDLDNVFRADSMTFLEDTEASQTNEALCPLGARSYAHVSFFDE